jgi:predicted  nucleic acid-binding Zn-ribbon protein
VGLKPVELLRKLDRLITLDVALREAVLRLSGDIAALKDRVAVLEAREDVLVARAQGAAAAAAATTAATSLSDLARRIGVLEERSRHPRLAPPADQ